MVYIAFELIFIYFLSKTLTQNLYSTLYLLSASRPMSVSLLAILFFPGTVIHELSHLFTAEILGVRTGGLTLVPEAIDKSEVRTGSVSIVQTDPIRRAIIGLAPLFVGLLAIVFIATYLQDYFWLALYGLFTISNSMFSSPEDLDGFPAVAIFLSLVFGALYYLGVRVTIPPLWISTLTLHLGYVAGLNMILFLGSKFCIILAQKLTGKRIIQKQN